MHTSSPTDPRILLLGFIGTCPASFLTRTRSLVLFVLPASPVLPAVPHPAAAARAAARDRSTRQPLPDPLHPLPLPYRHNGVHTQISPKSTRSQTRDGGCRFGPRGFAAVFLGIRRAVVHGFGWRSVCIYRMSGCDVAGTTSVRCVPGLEAEGKAGADVGRLEWRGAEGMGGVRLVRPACGCDDCWRVVGV